MRRGAVVVTGASTGIGAAAVRRLVADGFEAFGTIRRREDAAGLEAAGAKALLMDVTDAESITRARDDLTRQLGGRPMVGLVNNAGIPVAGPMELVPLDELRRVLEVNVVGVVAVTQAFLPLLRAARGRIVNVSSVSGLIALPFMGPYAASKFALEAISDSLRRELMPAGVDVIVVEPGVVRTPIWNKIGALDPARFRGTWYEAVMTRLAASIAKAVERGLPVEDVAAVIAKALTARRPPARMMIVPGSRLGRHLMRVIPDRWLDRLIASQVWRGNVKKADKVD